MINGNAPSSNSQFSFVNAFINAQGEIEANISFDAISQAPDNDLYFALYVFENNVSNNQAGFNAVAEHPNVLRKAFTATHDGELFASAGSSDITLNNTNFTTEVGTNWVPEELGLLAIVWEKTDNGYIIDHAQAVQNIGLLSSNNNSLNAENFNVINSLTSLNVISFDNKKYNCSLADTQGKLIHQSTFENEIVISTDQLTTGIYILNIENEGKYFSQKVFIK